MRTRAAWALLLLVLAATPLAPAQAQGCNALGVTPIRLELTGLQAGQSYRQVISVQNPCTFQRSITTERDGVAGGWATLSPATFDVAASSARDVEVLLRVPGNQGPGSQSGFLRFIAAAGNAPGGSGQAVSAAVAVPLNLTVGGTAVVKFAWSAPRVEDVPQGADVHAFALARNEGNVRAMALLRGDILPFTGAGSLQNATGSLSLDPGEEKEVQVTFPAGLAAGQYRAHLRADGLDETLPFKVTPPGATPPDGTLKALLHTARGTAGQPVRIDGWFQNTGLLPIRGAQLKAEVRKDGTLLAPLQSDALAVAPGQSVNLTVYWVPPSGGTYAIVGNVVYDGFLTPESQSLLNVDPAGAGFVLAWWWWLLAALAVAAVLASLLWRRRSRGPVARKPGPPSDSRRLRQALARKPAPQPKPAHPKAPDDRPKGPKLT
ncbi:MAG: hypothetical protein QOG31_1887 [Thermoplasmata archaeon]|nr:hypothetical protein [Thermoplasmata archaeon]